MIREVNWRKALYSTGCQIQRYYLWLIKSSWSLLVDNNYTAGQYRRAYNFISALIFATYHLWTSIWGSTAIFMGFFGCDYDRQLRAEMQLCINQLWKSKNATVSLGWTTLYQGLLNCWEGPGCPWVLCCYREVMAHWCGTGVSLSWCHMV